MQNLTLKITFSPYLKVQYHVIQDTGYTHEKDSG